MVAYGLLEKAEVFPCDEELWLACRVGRYTDEAAYVLSASWPGYIEVIYFCVLHSCYPFGSGVYGRVMIEEVYPAVYSVVSGHLIGDIPDD